MSGDEPRELDAAERLAAIQHRLEMLMRDAREIRAASAKLSDRDPFEILRNILAERGYQLPDD